MYAPDEIAAWIDKLEIQQVIVQYSDAATRGNWDVLEALFTADATYEMALQTETVLQGARTIRETIAASVDKSDLFVQVTHGSVVMLLGDTRATATTTVQARARQDDGSAFAQYALYYDDLVKTGDGWRFTKRRLQPLYFETDPFSGTTAIPRSHLR